MKHPTSSACLPTPEPAPAPLHSKQPPVRLWCPGGPLSSPTPQRRPSLPACCLKTSLPTTIWTEIFQPSATSLPTPALPCQPVACQPGSGRSGLILSLPQAHLKTGQYKNSLCLETTRLKQLCTSGPACGQKGAETKRKHRHSQRHVAKTSKNNVFPPGVITVSSTSCRHVSERITKSNLGLLAFNNKIHEPPCVTTALQILRHQMHANKFGAVIYIMRRQRAWLGTMSTVCNYFYCVKAIPTLNLGWRYP